MQVVLLAAMTVDGFIARSEDDRSFDWTSPEDKQFYVSQLKQADAIVMGRKSFTTFSRYPKNSRWIIYTSQPEQFENPKPAVIQAEGTKESPAELISRLQADGCQRVAICGGASIYAQFLEAGVVDRLYLTIEPIVFGDGVRLFGDQLTHHYQLELMEHQNISDQTMVLTYRTKS